VRDLTHRILFLAGTALLAAAILYGAPSTSTWPDPGITTPVRVASAADLLAVVVPVRAAMNRNAARNTDTVKPNAAGCPDANTSSLLPPASDLAENPEQNSAPANGKFSTCPNAASDAQTDIARGQGLAKPEPFNSKQLIAPTPKSRG
jgi:hypothetical protein